MTDSRFSTTEPGSALQDPGAPLLGPPVGWVTFAGTMLVIGGAFNIFIGLVALNRTGVLTSPTGVIIFDVTGWGWVHLIAGILLLISGLGVFSGNAVARTAAVVIAGLNALAQLAFLPAYPLWALVVIALDIVIIWALLTHGTTPTRS